MEEQSDPDLNEEEKLAVSKLTEEQLQDIDNALLAATSKQWRKIARIVGTAMMDQPNRVLGIPDLYYAQRIASFVEAGKLEANGNLKFMRFCEVRFKQRDIPGKNN